MAKGPAFGSEEWCKKKVAQHTAMLAKRRAATKAKRELLPPKEPKYKTGKVKVPKDLARWKPEKAPKVPKEPKYKTGMVRVPKELARYKPAAKPRGPWKNLEPII